LIAARCASRECCSCEQRGRQQRAVRRRTSQWVDHLKKSFVCRRTPASTKVGLERICENNLSAQYHFRFQVSLQAVCCYFRRVVESRFLNKSLFRNNVLGRGNEAFASAQQTVRHR
jgi:hypothetical protein